MSSNVYQTFFIVIQIELVILTYIFDLVFTNICTYIIYLLYLALKICLIILNVLFGSESYTLLRNHSLGNLEVLLNLNSSNMATS